MSQLAGVDVPGLVAHFERVLGPVRTGWLTGPTGEPLPFQVVRYTHGPDVGALAYSSLGLNRHRLVGADGGEARQEFLMLITKSLPVEYVLGVLRDAGQAALATRRAFRQGDVLGPVVPPVPGSAMTALYVAMPVYFDDEFATHVSETGIGVDVMWLVPITTAEARFVRAYGWETFEELLVDQDPDLVDVFRPEVELPVDLPVDLPSVPPGAAPLPQREVRGSSQR